MQGFDGRGAGGTTRGTWGPVPVVLGWAGWELTSVCQCMFCTVFQIPGIPLTVDCREIFFTFEANSVCQCMLCTVFQIPGIPLTVDCREIFFTFEANLVIFTHNRNLD